MDADNDQCLLVLKDIKFQASGKDYINRALSNAKCTKKRKRKENRENSKKNECSVCGAKFNTYSNKVEHMVTHLNEKPFPCNICDYAAKSKSNLNKHKLTHTNKVKTCCVCYGAFDNKLVLQEHMKEHKNEKRNVCNECNKSFFKRKEYLVHMKLHDTQSKKYPCDECNKCFVLRSRLKRHKLIHVKDKSFGCTTCNKKFARMDDLKSHERTHTGERPYKCTQCEKAFKFMSNYCAHKKICKKTENDKTKYDCKPCNISLRDENKLKIHLKSKNHEKRILLDQQDLPSSFLCDQCNRNIPVNARDNHLQACFQLKKTSSNNQFIISDISETLCSISNNSSMSHYLKIDDVGIQANNNGLLISTLNSNKKSESIKPIEETSNKEREISVIATLEGAGYENSIPIFHRECFDDNNGNILAKTDSNIRAVIGVQNNSSFILGGTLSNDVPSESSSLRVLPSSQIVQSPLLESFIRSDVHHL
ncbi:unnamed protein product [Meganyctiphanes norvegica]|uniref:C2H2-type domain-containing protein n=1 Tax=Meganyctiphanes norvegica TaxID=48144 RepID=A0AAV2RQB1_MEGNR